MTTIDDVYKEIQSRLDLQLAIIVGTGSSMSIDYNFGMGALEKHLSSIIPKLISTDSMAIKQWERVKKLLENGVDFENSLNEVSSEFLLSSIITETGRHVVSVSLANLDKIHQGHIPFHVLLEKLKNKLSFSHPRLDIITPNYDLVIENALAYAGMDYTDGFWGEYMMEFNWKQAKDSRIRLSSGLKGKGLTAKSMPFVRLHKIHGSLNYFINEGAVNRIDTLAYLPKPSIHNRFIITPGTSKFKKVTENRKLYSEMDEAINLAQTYLFVGYGFNDIDIDKDICQHLESKSKKAIIVTKELTSFKGLELYSNEDNIIIVDNGDNGAKISYLGNEFNIERPVWQIDEFANYFL